MHDDPEAELVWDLHALAAVDRTSDEDAAAAGMASTVASLYPSLHLNLADVYRRLDRPARAASHVDLGRAALIHVEPGPYRTMFVDAFDRVATAISLAVATAAAGADAAAHIQSGRSTRPPTRTRRTD